jgi:catechol 2,3-dioxygenase-like lactoylglutathione lyase family enzyme
MTSIYDRITKGDMHQTAFVTNDLDRAIAQWNDVVGGPPLVKDEIRGISDFEYYGEKADTAHDQTISYLGGMQIEYIQPVSGRNVYFDALEGAAPGTIQLHHVGFDCVDVEEYREAKAELIAKGFSVAQGGRFGDTEFAYFDLRPVIGTFLELLWLDAPTRAGFDEVRARYERTGDAASVTD